MTIKNILRSAAAILISTTLFSCIESDKKIGSGLLPDDHIINVSLAEFNLPVMMRMSDSLQTVSSGYLVVGSYKDTDFGLIDASASFQFIPYSDTITFGDNPQPISFKLYLTIDTKHYLNSSEAFIPQNFYVYKLNKDLDSNTVYNNSISYGDFDPIPLNLGGNVFFGGDSLVMDLSLDYARELLSATAEEMDSLALYFRRFKGLHMRVDPLPGSLEGGRFNIFSPGSVYFTLTYRHVDALKGIDKDSVISYFGTESIASVNSFSHSTASFETNTTGEKLFVEGLAGIKPYIDFSSVKTQIDQWAAANNINLAKLIVAKAEIRLPYEMPQDYTRLNYFPEQLFLVSRQTSDKDHHTLYEPVNDIRYSDLNGSVNKSLKYYSLDVSSYIQKLIQGSHQSSLLKTWITPIYQTTDYYSGATFYYVQNVFYNKAILNGNGSARSPRLVLTYAIMP